MKDPIQETAIEADRVANSQFPSIYGGLRVDNRTQTVRVLLTSLDGSAEATLRDRVSHSEYLRFEQGRFTLADLLAVQRRIDGDFSYLLAQGVHVTMTGIGYGAVDVAVAETSPDVAAFLRSRYGDAINVSLGQVASTTATQTREGPPPFMGGMELDDIGNASAVTSGFYNDCTLGYIGQNYINGQAFYYVITAGHCFGETSLVYHWVNATGTPVPIGDVVSNWYFSGSNADTLAAAIRGGYTLATNEIITAEPYVHTVDYLDASPVDGLGVCLSGITTDQTCNFQVNNTNATINAGEKQPDGTIVYTTLYNQITACCDAADFGDSGGPIYHYYQPQAIAGEGIQSVGFYSNGAYTGQIGYSFIQNVRNDLGMVICTQTPQPFGC